MASGSSSSPSPLSPPDMPSVSNLLAAAAAASTLILQPWPLAPSIARSWVSTNFTAVDDRVRGGSSTSLLTVVGGNPPSTLGGDRNVDPPPQTGEALFSGFLDTTTLGGAGFASQLYASPIPVKLDNETYKGLTLLVRKPEKDAPAAQPLENGTYPGGGKAPVSSYVLGLKMDVPANRPDGRRESGVNYEWRIDIPTSGTDVGNAVKDEAGLLTFAAEWKDFHASYRGRPKPDAPPIDIAKVKEWSIMARSDFGAQSGPFKLQMVSLGALKREAGPIVHPGAGQAGNSKVSPGSSVSFPAAIADVEKRGLPSSSDVLPLGPARLNRTESYGFALYVFSSLLLLLWVLWALVPDAALHSLGIEWYPSRQWAFLIPAWSAFAMLFAYATFIGLNLFHAAGREDIRGLTDSHAHLLPLNNASIFSGDSKHPLSSISTLEETDATCRNSDAEKEKENEEGGPLSGDIYDLPPSLVSRWRGFGAL